MAHSESNSSRSPSAEKQKKREKYDDADYDCLYIGNIDKRLSQDKLNQAFSEIGELDYCYIVYEPYSATDRTSRTEPKQSRGYGFAKYKDSSNAAKAKEKLQGMELNGRKITVEFSKRSKPREPTPGRYLGKKRSSPVHRSHNRRSYSRSQSSRSRSKSHKKRRYNDKHHEKKHRRQRSRSDSYRRKRSYSKSPRR